MHIEGARQESGLSSQRDPGERLDGACRGDVFLPVLADQEPLNAELAGQLCRAVASHRQARAVLRPVRCEAAEDGDGARGRWLLPGCAGTAGGADRWSGMVGRPVMPGLVVTPGVPAEDVGGQPVNLASPRTEAVAGVLHPGRGDVEEGLTLPFRLPAMAGKFFRWRRSDQLPPADPRFRSKQLQPEYDGLLAGRLASESLEAAAKWFAQECAKAGL